MMGKVVRKYGPTKAVAGGASVTFTGFAMFHVLNATVHQFNTEVLDKCACAHVDVCPPIHIFLVRM